jgi:hypothetical protein
MPFQIEYSPEALKHLESFRKFDQTRVLDEVERMFASSP